MRSTLTCLSVRQPWAWCIVNGHKDVENRTWATQHRGDLLIHAGQVFDQEGLLWVRQRFPRLALPEHFPLGGVVGSCQLLNCTQASSSPWFMGPYAFVLWGAKPMPLVPLRGRLGLWEVPITSELHAAMRSSTHPAELADSGQAGLFS